MNDDTTMKEYIVQYTMDRVHWSYDYSFATDSEALQRLESIRNDELYKKYIKAVRIIEKTTTQHVYETIYIKA